MDQSMHMDGHQDLPPIEDSDYTQYQIAASEALRAGSKLTNTKEEKQQLFQQAAFYSAKAFAAAKENVYFRFLALSQYQCASALLLLVETDYHSNVTRIVDPELMRMSIKDAFKGLEYLENISVQEAVNYGL